MAFETSFDSEPETRTDDSLSAERRAMREELEGLRRGESVVPFRSPKRDHLGRNPPR
jgi:hypothetical protein